MSYGLCCSGSLNLEDAVGNLFVYPDVGIIGEAVIAAGLEKLLAK
jgi:hypothetical protein